MRILNVTAQKPDSTGSGVYLAEMVRCEVAAGHSAAVICGIAPDDPLPFPAGVSAYPVHFETDEVPFPVCGRTKCPIGQRVIATWTIRWFLAFALLLRRESSGL